MLPGPLHEAIPLYEPGKRITAEAMVDLPGGIFVVVDPSHPHIVGLNGQVVGVLPSTGPGAVLGVTAHDAPEGSDVAIIGWGVLPVTASEAIVAGDVVGPGPDGTAVVAGDPVGLALSNADVGEEVFVRLTFRGPGGAPPPPVVPPPPVLTSVAPDSYTMPGSPAITYTGTDFRPDDTIMFGTPPVAQTKTDPGTSTQHVAPAVTLVTAGNQETWIVNAEGVESNHLWFNAIPPVE